MLHNLYKPPFSCGPGWTELIQETLDQITKFVKERDMDISVLQIKEKYGELRIYLSAYIDEIEEIIDRATMKSREICEVCGAPGKLHQVRSNFMTKCDQCFSDSYSNIIKGTRNVHN